MKKYAIVSILFLITTSGLAGSLLSSFKSSYAISNCSAHSKVIITAIHDIQGKTNVSPIQGQRVTIEAVVIGDFKDRKKGLSGFFVQEENADKDNNELTSEGIFVYDKSSGVNVTVGDVVRVNGKVVEYYGLTEINAVKKIEICGKSTNRIQPADIFLPLKSVTQLEQYEGMLVRFRQQLTVTENYNLARFGEVAVSARGRLFQPTDYVNPGADAIALQKQNNLNHLIVDDGSSKQNSDPIAYPENGLSAKNTLRIGNVVNEIIGIVSFTAKNYRIHPTRKLHFISHNTRPVKPVLPAKEILRIASFNVFNYFNGDGRDGGFPTSRGADSLSEFKRQRNKIITAIIALKADIIGLMEIENDGYDKISAIQDLVNGLNEKASKDRLYAFVSPPVIRLGTDAIMVALIYREETVKPVGKAAILTSKIDPQFNDKKNRPVLAQTFSEINTGSKITVAVNHFKSKGSSCKKNGDPDIGDGQGNCNLTRRRAAQALINWLSADPTKSKDEDYLVIGDFNAYAKEDPVRVLLKAGYYNLAGVTNKNSAYSFNFKGQSGNLDYAFVNKTLKSQVVNVMHWHINADEPRVLDYNKEYKSANQIKNLYSNDAYRSSDHDPVIVDFKLN